MKETGLIMKGPLVVATLADRKSQTRRTTGLDDVNIRPNEWKYIGTDPCDPPNFLFDSKVEPGDRRGIKCPYGQPGDRLWVRETHYVEKWWHRQKGVRLQGHYLCDTSLFAITLTEAEASRWYDRVRNEGSFPSIFMFRSLSRITLEITEVRVERLQDISEEDAIAEGMEWLDTANRGAITKSHAKENYRVLWDSINGAGSWDKNPWVWVISFKRI